MTGEGKFTRQSLILPVYLPAFLLSFGNGVVAPTLSLYIKSFNLSYTMTTFVIAVSVIGNIPAGILLERIGRKPAMLIGTIVLSLSTLGIGFAHHVAELIIYQLIGGIGIALWGLSRHAYMTDVIPVEERGRSIALFGGINRIGTFTGQVSSIFLGTSLRTPFFVYAVASISTAFLCALFIVEIQRDIEMKHPSSSHMERLLVLLKTNYKSLTTAGIGQICVQTIRRGRTIIIPLYASKVIGLTPQSIRLIVMFSSSVDMLMFPIAGFIMDKLGRKYAMVPGFTIFASGIFIMGYANSFVFLLVAAIIIGFGNGLCSGTMMTLGADLAPSAGVGEFLSMWRFIGNFGGAVGPLVVGNIADIWDLKISCLALAGIGYTAVLIFLLMVPETLKLNNNNHDPEKKS